MANDSAKNKRSLSDLTLEPLRPPSPSYAWGKAAEYGDERTMEAAVPGRKRKSRRTQGRRRSR